MREIKQLLHTQAIQGGCTCILEECVLQIDCTSQITDCFLIVALKYKDEKINIRISPSSQQTLFTILIKFIHFIWTLLRHLKVKSAHNCNILPKNSENYRSDVIHKITHSNPTPFQSYTLTLPILHSSNTTHFHSHSFTLA